MEIDAQHTAAADALPRPLRSRFRVRLRRSVRGAADKAAYLMGCQSPYRPWPDADGEHIRGVGRSQPTSGSDVTVPAALRYGRIGRSALGGEHT